MQSRVPVKNGNKRLYPAKITRELLLCATSTTTTVDAKSLTFFSRSCFRAHMYENMKVTLAELIKNTAQFCFKSLRVLSMWTDIFQANLGMMDSRSGLWTIIVDNMLITQVTEPMIEFQLSYRSYFPIFRRRLMKWPCSMLYMPETTYEMTMLNACSMINQLIILDHVLKKLEVKLRWTALKVFENAPC